MAANDLACEVPPAVREAAADDNENASGLVHPAPGQRGPGNAAGLTGLGAAALLAACGGGSEGDGTGDTPAASPAVVDFSVAGFSRLAANSDEEAARFLQQAQFSSTTAEIQAVRNEGFPMWLARQYQAPMGQRGWDWLEARGYGAVDSHQYFFQMYPADFMIWNQLLSGQNMMRKRCALALSEFFVTSLSSAEFTWRSHAYASWWDMLVRNAFGNFRQLLEDVTLHPAMGYFLNTKGNQKENAGTGRVPDENYAREVMQLFTIGLVRLNLDGTPQMSNGQPLESYTQGDVTGLARVFTGWDFDTTDGVRHNVSNYTIESKAFARKPMRLRPERHSTMDKQFLGTTVAGSASGEAALKAAMDTLADHPNVGPFFARQMIQRLVTSNPSPAYVARVAARFNDNGKGERGDLTAVWTAILLDEEARGPASLADTAHGKLREPMIRFIQWARTFGVTSAAGSWKIFDLGNAGSALGQSPLRAPSVFNFFRPGYVPPGSALAPSGATAPEFQILNESSVGGFLNFMQDAIQNGINCPQPSVPQAAYTAYSRDVQANYTQALALVTDATALVDHVCLVLAAGQISPDQRALMVNALNQRPVTAASSSTQKNERVWAAVFMVIACPQYMIQK